jgi:RimJ/RimL family protein N-acetyltransferase
MDPSGLPHAFAPRLETARLTLRGHRLDDFPASRAMWAEPLVVRHISGKPSTEEESWARLLRNAGHWLLLGFGYWLVEEKATGRFVGEVGFANFHRELQPPIGDRPEAGWALASWAHGQGFATEAVRAAHIWGDANFGGRSTVCMIAPEHTASIQVARKCGYRELTHATYRGSPTLLFERAARGEG